MTDVYPNEQNKKWFEKHCSTYMLPIKALLLKLSRKWTNQNIQLSCVLSVLKTSWCAKSHILPVSCLHNTGRCAEMPLIVPFFLSLWFQPAALYNKIYISSSWTNIKLCYLNLSIIYSFTGWGETQKRQFDSSLCPSYAPVLVSTSLRLLDTNFILKAFLVFRASTIFFSICSDSRILELTFPLNCN
jgi:hypothetical protein